MDDIAYAIIIIWHSESNIKRPVHDKSTLSYGSAQVFAMPIAWIRSPTMRWLFRRLNLLDAHNPLYLTQNDDTSTRAPIQHNTQLAPHNIIQLTNHIIAIILLRS